jgi:regulator of PEP synthase PpsR (kinase-PPPase family)
MSLPRLRKIFVASDSTGSTAERVVRAALVQFGGQGAQVEVWPRIRTLAEAAAVVQHAAGEDALLVHTLVNRELRESVRAHALRAQLPAVDLLGTLLEAMSDYLEQAPRELPGSSVVLDDAYFQRVEAMEFSVKADDGQLPGLLTRADIVLVGVSRTSKTPVSAYLANQGYKVANVPLVRGIEPEPVLFELPPGRVFALTIDPARLHDIRRRRLVHLGAEHARGGYADLDEVFAEVRWALQLFRQRTAWPVLDVTSLAVEETASEILKQKALLEAGLAP